MRDNDLRADMTAVRRTLKAHKPSYISRETGGVIVRCRCGIKVYEGEEESEPIDDAFNEHFLNELKGPSLA